MKAYMLQAKDNESSNPHWMNKSMGFGKKTLEAAKEHYDLIANTPPSKHYVERGEMELRIVEVEYSFTVVQA